VKPGTALDLPKTRMKILFKNRFQQKEDQIMVWLLELIKMLIQLIILKLQQATATIQESEIPCKVTTKASSPRTACQQEVHIQAATQISK